MLPENPFAGASRDPIALLEQLIGQVAGVHAEIAGIHTEMAGIHGEIAELRQGIRDVKQDLAEVKQGLAEVKQDLAAVKQDLRQFKQEVNTRFDKVHAEMAAWRTGFARFTESADREQDDFRRSVESAIQRKELAQTNITNTRLAELEHRIDELEAAERRRKAGEGA